MQLLSIILKYGFTDSAKKKLKLRSVQNLPNEIPANYLLYIIGNSYKKSVLFGV